MNLGDAIHEDRVEDVRLVCEIFPEQIHQGLDSCSGKYKHPRHLGLKPLHTAAQKPEMVDLLLKHRADVNGTNMVGQSALFYANTHVATGFLAHGADPCLRDQVCLCSVVETC